MEFDIFNRITKNEIKDNSISTNFLLDLSK